MKIIFLNIWHATCRDELTAFIKQEAPTTDIFCFQEADPEARQQLRTILAGFDEHTSAKDFGERGAIELATYSKQSQQRVTRTQALLHDIPNTGHALITYFEQDAHVFAVTNVHGISPVGDTKLDTPGRLVQSQTIIAALKDAEHPVIVGGDFNLSPNTKSVELFETAGYQNLVTDNHIKTTRNRLAWERYPDTPQYYADFAFVSSGVPVHSFTVPANEVSDHLPLIVELELPRS